MKSLVVVVAAAAALLTAVPAQADPFSEAICHDLDDGMSVSAVAQSLADTDWNDGTRITTEQGMEAVRAIVQRSCPRHLPKVG